MSAELQSLLLEALRLCEDCGYSKQAGWFGHQINRLQDEHQLQDALSEIDSALAGMGSFSDLALQPPIDYHLDRLEVQARQWELVEVISETIETLQAS